MSRTTITRYQTIDLDLSHVDLDLPEATLEFNSDGDCLGLKLVWRNLWDLISEENRRTILDEARQAILENEL